MAYAGHVIRGFSGSNALLTLKRKLGRKKARDEGLERHGLTIRCSGQRK